MLCGTEQPTHPSGVRMMYVCGRQTAAVVSGECGTRKTQSTTPLSAERRGHPSSEQQQRARSVVVGAQQPPPPRAEERERMKGQSSRAQSVRRATTTRAEGTFATPPAPCVECELGQGLDYVCEKTQLCM